MEGSGVGSAGCMLMCMESELCCASCYREWLPCMQKVME